MHKRDFILVSIASLFVALIIASLQPVPGYIDADYYYANGIQLVNGKGFTEPFIWNYLDNPQTVPHPSNSYWYPLASIVAAAGMLVSGKVDFLSARIFFVLIAASVPPLITALSFQLTGNRFLSLLSGILAIFSGFYLPFIVTTDNYGILLLSGSLFFLLLSRFSVQKSILIGITAGLINLARGDGIIWLPLAIAAVIMGTHQKYGEENHGIWKRRSILASLLVFLGFALIMGGWMVRNILVFGAIFPPGAGYTLWMTKYDQIFSFYPWKNTLQTWLASGWQSITLTRLNALWQNIGTAFSAQGLVILSPFILIGAWNTRKNILVQAGVLGWIALLLAESVIFPLASVSGGFFHAGTAFQPLWYVLAPIGLNGVVSYINKKWEKFGWIGNFINITLIILVVLLSSFLVKIRVIDSGWNEGEYLYQKVDAFLDQHGAEEEDVVLVRNPPAYFIMTGRYAIVVPYDEISTLLAVSRKFDAKYVILEKMGTPAQLAGLYNQSDKYPGFIYLGSIDESHIYFIQPSQ
jgi:hypothetical protein